MQHFEIRQLEQRLGDRELSVRMEAVRELQAALENKAVQRPVCEGYTNNHVHTTFSFSPYTPANAVWQAIRSGLCTVGIVDHDSVSGAEEFIKAGEALSIATTVGFEVRTDWSDTPFAGRRVNNPDQLTSAYICAHGVPHSQMDKADKFLAGIRSAREKRSRAMTERLNGLLRTHGIEINYDKDIIPLSYAEFGGEVTERHMLFALTKQLLAKYGKGEELISFLTGKMGIAMSESQLKLLRDMEYEYYDYDVLNILKGSFVTPIYIESTTDETPPVAEAVAAIRDMGAIPTYCYLGDVGASPTGDKKEQKFEDDYLDDLFPVCRELDFDAIAYMPSRNTIPQLQRVMALCDKYSFLQISGEDINQPRQSFICRQLKDPMFAHLADTAWALVGHEIAATDDIRKGFFGDGSKPDAQEISKRIQKYKAIGAGQ